jgi:hypothetical protein
MVRFTHLPLYDPSVHNAYRPAEIKNSPKLVSRWQAQGAGAKFLADVNNLQKHAVAMLPAETSLRGEH